MPAKRTSTAPAHLPDDIRAVWDSLPAGHSGPEYEAYCGQIARLRDAQRRLAAEGIVVADQKGNAIPHPAVAVEKQAQAEIRAWGTRFTTGTTGPWGR